MGKFVLLAFGKFTKPYCPFYSNKGLAKMDTPMCTLISPYGGESDKKSSVLLWVL